MDKKELDALREKYSVVSEASVGAWKAYELAKERATALQNQQDSLRSQVWWAEEELGESHVY